MIHYKLFFMFFIYLYGRQSYQKSGDQYITVFWYLPTFMYFGHLIRRVDSLEKTLMLGGIEGQEEKGTTEDEMAGWHH